MQPPSASGKHMRQFGKRAPRGSGERFSFVAIGVPAILPQVLCPLAIYLGVLSANAVL
jgi:hypothetical protein